MAAEEPTWHGPRTLTRVRQVCIPVKLLRALDLDEGSEVQFALDLDRHEIRIRPVSGGKKDSDE